MLKKRKSRDKIDKEEINLLEPLDIYKYGSDEDPCFGKLHDITAKECQMCGDAEFCAIVMSQNLTKGRIEIEANQRFKDIEEADMVLVKKREKAKELIQEYEDQGMNGIKIRLRIAKELNLPKEEVKKIYNLK